MKMGRILIFEDIVNDLSARPREVTLIGEENLISREKGCDKDYDLYYCYVNGIGHNTIFDAKFKQIPVFLNLEMQTLGDYHERYPKGIIGFYGTDRKLLLCSHGSLKAFENGPEKIGLEGKANFTTIKREELFERQKESGIYDFEEEIGKKCEYLQHIKNHIVQATRL